MALAGPLVVGVVYCREYGRAFSIGGLAGYGAWAVAVGNAAGFDFPSSIQAYESAPNLVELLRTSEFGMSVAYFGICWPVVAIAGVIGVIVRRSIRPTSHS
jgi:hypothetical protein